MTCRAVHGCNTRLAADSVGSYVRVGQNSFANATDTLGYPGAAWMSITGLPFGDNRDSGFQAWP